MLAEDAPALRGHDPGQRETHPHHSLPYGPTDLKNLAEEPGLPHRSPMVLAGCSTVGQWVLLTAMARPEAVLREK